MIANPNIASTAPSDRFASRMLVLVVIDQHKGKKHSIAEMIAVGKMHFSSALGVLAIAMCCLGNFDLKSIYVLRRTVLFHDGSHGQLSNEPFVVLVAQRPGWMLFWDDRSRDVF